MTGGFDRSKSLQEIEQQDWGEPTYNSYLVIRCHRLRRKPLNQFTPGDLRIMIGQQISLPILIPLAVECLEQEPLVQGDYFPGDLLSVMLKIDERFWATHPDSLQRVRRIVDRVKATLPSLDEISGPTITEILETAPRLLTSRA
jgi:hypothetical protein